MYGQAIDIRTEGPRKDNSHLGGQWFHEFVQTPQGLDLLHAYDLRVLYHKVAGDSYHIDLAYEPHLAKEKRYQRE